MKVSFKIEFFLPLHIKPFFFLHCNKNNLKQAVRRKFLWIFYPIFLFQKHKKPYKKKQTKPNKFLSETILNNFLNNPSQKLNPEVTRGWTLPKIPETLTASIYQEAFSCACSIQNHQEAEVLSKISVIHGAREENGLFNGKDKIRVPKQRENLLFFFLTKKLLSKNVTLYLLYEKHLNLIDTNHKCYDIEKIYASSRIR